MKKQEDLLRNLAKTRENLELEEHIIGRTRDFYAGSRYDKYGYSIGRAEKLKRLRTKAKVCLLLTLLNDTSLCK